MQEANLTLFFAVFSAETAGFCLPTATSPRVSSELEQARPQTSGEEELQLQLALAMSREVAEQVGARVGFPKLSMLGKFRFQPGLFGFFYLNYYFQWQLGFVAGVCGVFLLLLFLFFKSLFKVTSASELLGLVEDDSHFVRRLGVGGC